MGLCFIVGVGGGRAIVMADTAPVGLDPGVQQAIKNVDSTVSPLHRAEAQKQFEQLNASGVFAAAALQALPKNMPAAHARFHPHATKDCDLLTPASNPKGWVFDASAHNAALIAETKACPICNPPPARRTAVAVPQAASSPPVPSAAPSAAKSTKVQRIEQFTDSLNQINSGFDAINRQHAQDTLATRELNANAPSPTRLAHTDGTPDLRTDTRPVYTNPDTLPRTTKNYGLLDFGTDVAGYGNFTGAGKDGAAGVPQSIALAKPGNPHALDHDNSVSLVHDKVLALSGGKWYDLLNPKVVDAHKYAAANYESPLLRTIFQGLVKLSEYRVQAEGTMHEAGAAVFGAIHYPTVESLQAFDHQFP